MEILVIDDRVKTHECVTMQKMEDVECTQKMNDLKGSLLAG